MPEGKSQGLPWQGQGGEGCLSVLEPALCLSCCKENFPFGVNEGNPELLAETWAGQCSHPLLPVIVSDVNSDGVI